MKNLYQPVFWSGFALSLSALYYSSEQHASGADAGARKPVLMQISLPMNQAPQVELGNSIQKQVNSAIDGEIDNASPLLPEQQETLPEVSLEPIPIEDAETSSEVVDFLSIAEKLLNEQK